MRRIAAVAAVVPILAAGCAGTSSSAAPSTSRSTTGSSTGSTTSPAAGGKYSYVNWSNYHRTAGKTGLAAGAVTLPLHSAWTKSLDGSVWSEPVLAHGVLIAATEHDQVYGLNPTTGKQIWHVSLGTPQSSGEPCGDITPIGITGAPAYDPKTGSVFVVATTGTGNHTLWALSAATGHERWHRSADVDKNRDRNAEQQRAALLVTDNRVIVTYGAHAGDCGNYVGYALSAATTGKGKIPYYAVPNARQSGMWSPAGPVVAYNGDVITPTANGSNRNPSSKWDHSDGVIELNPMTMHYVRGWAPKNWEQGDADDLSLSSTSPVRIAKNKYIVGGKRGEVWLLKKTLGGVNGELDTLGGDNFCQTFGGIAVKGDLALLPCKNFSTPHSIVAVRVKGNHLHEVWRTNNIYGSPIIAGNRVFVADLDSANLKVLSLKTGKVLSSIEVGSLPTFPSEVVDGNHVFVGTLDGVTAVRGS